MRARLEGEAKERSGMPAALEEEEAFAKVPQGEGNLQSKQNRLAAVDNEDRSDHKPRRLRGEP